MDSYEYARNNRDEFLQELIELLRIPSISTLSKHKPDIRRAADWLKAHLEQIGMTRTEIFETPGNPLVYGEWLGAGDAPTVLVYGHYDVQPADDRDGKWQSDPFEPVIRNGNLYARGATDDKGQTLTQIKAVQSLLATDGMPVNIKFLIEGEEEFGSNNIHPFVKANTELLQADVVLVSDTDILALDKPSVVVGLRGIVAFEIEVQGPSDDLHSGMYGGMVHNPLQALVEILSAMHDADGKVTVPGFYDKVRMPDEATRAELAKTPYTLARFAAETGAPEPWGEPGYALHERVGIRPTFEINGLVGGWTGEGSKTVLPARALAKLTCRLVPDQDPKEIFELVEQYVQDLTPDTVTSIVRFQHQGMWAVVDPNSSYMRAASRAYEFGFGAPPVFVRGGGSIPIVGTFQKALDAPVILMGFGLPDDNLHAPNEKFTLECFYRGINTAIKFYQEIGA